MTQPIEGQSSPKLQVRMGCFHECDGWHSGVLSQLQISEALGENAVSLSELLDCQFFDQFVRQEQKGSTRCFDLSPGMRANLAIAHALWRQARISSEIAAQVVFSWPQIGASVAAIVDFQHNQESSDPFRFFETIADDALPVQVTDEYLDLVDERFLLWRRPEIEPVVTARNLDERSRHVLANPHDFVTRQEFLQQLAGFKRSVCHDRVWLGQVKGETFLPQPTESGKERRLPSSVFEQANSAISTFETNYRTKISINISLAARMMKRRALGLRVSIPGAALPR
jgi:hypothetical protein